MLRFDPNKKKYLHVSSLDNILPTTNNSFFKVKLPQAIQPVILELLCFVGYATSSCPIGFEQQYYPNNVFLLPLDESAAGGSSLINLQFPVQIYNAITFCSKFQELLNSNTTVGAVYTVTPNLVTFKYTITSTKQFTIPWLDVQNSTSDKYIPYEYGYDKLGWSPTNDKIGRGPYIAPNYSVPVYNYAATLVGSTYQLESPYNYQFTAPSPLFINLLEFPNNMISSSFGTFNFMIPVEVQQGGAIVWKSENNYPQIVNLISKQIDSLTVEITGSVGALFYQGSNRVDLLFSYVEPSDIF